MKRKKVLKFAIFSILIFVLIYSALDFIIRGEIEVVVHNDTTSEQTIWLQPEEEFTYTIPPGKKRKINYSTEHSGTSLMLNYQDIEGDPQEVTISEYVEAHEQGRVKIEIKQLNTNEEIFFEVTDKIN